MRKYIHYSKEEHYLLAEKLLSTTYRQINAPQPSDKPDSIPLELKLQIAQIHATLATVDNRAGCDDEELRRSKLYDECNEDPNEWAFRF